MNNPNAPVLVGVGQVVNRIESLEQVIEPLDSRCRKQCVQPMLNGCLNFVVQLLRGPIHADPHQFMPMIFKQVQCFIQRVKWAWWRALLKA